jgi:hypothetical protein
MGGGKWEARHIFFFSLGDWVHRSLRFPHALAYIAPPRRWVKDASVTGSSRLADVPQLIHPDDLGMPTYFVGSRPAGQGGLVRSRPIGHVQSPLHPGT